MASDPPEILIDRHAPTRRIALDERSWVDLTEGFVPDAVRAVREIHDAASWMQSEVLRYDHFVPEKRLSAVLRADRHAVLRQTEMHLVARYRRTPLTGVAAILYRDGDDFQGMHSDREMRWLDDTIIAILVLGERRPFALRRRVAASQAVERVPGGRDPDDLILRPGHGDLLVMGGACQAGWLHGVPRVTEPIGPRLSLTWRWTSRRGRPDTNPGYSDGRQYADRPTQPGIRRRRA